ncbi:hypothetical protein AB0F91_34120 [Amycolatopsis sp. NPDC023774]|uniref:hypothetical protein n=1 Tax=Amycolatopsis sp. NPDC023774 TaxID=3155015 RepID=UPI0033D5DFC4
MDPARRPIPRRFRTELAVDDTTWARGRAWALTAPFPDPSRPAAAADTARLEELLADLE